MPYNSNEYSYTAKPSRDKNELTFEGHGVESLLRHVWHIAKQDLNDKCIAGQIKEGTAYEISVNWKDAKFMRIMTARPLKLGENVAD